MRFPQQLVPSRNKAGTDSVGLSENMTQPGASTGVRRWQRYKIDMRLRVSVLTKKNAPRSSAAAQAIHWQMCFSHAISLVETDSSVAASREAL